MKLRNIFAALSLASATVGAAFAQEKAPANWFNLDPNNGGVQGVGTEEVYKKLLAGKTSQTVIVAVLDSGVDVEHEDLQGKVWVNADEIPNNGIDDDKNGYIDDINGWNFIGGKDGKNVNQDNLEVTRLYNKFRKKFGARTDEKGLSKADMKEFAIYKTVRDEVEKNRKEATEELAALKGIANAVDQAGKDLAGKEFNANSINALATEDQNYTIAKRLLARAAMSGALTFDDAKKMALDRLAGAKEHYEGQLNYHYNPDFDSRTVVGDNYDNFNEKNYGNNDVEGPDASHGTHVAGIIAAVRDNDQGMSGVATDVRIMSVRCVPDGDERDKDVANAIRYAVDNGASIINMSFGKGFSWNKKAVDEAVKYAVKHDVLLVHAAGNSSLNTDVANNFPNDTFEKKGLFGPKSAASWLEVGALSWKKGEDRVAPFSNYAKKNVDLFSPGVDIYSTVPNSEYRSMSGTSMASPVTAGVAALLRSYFPTLTAAQVKQVLMSSVDKSSDKVKKPGTDEKIAFSELSVTGGTVNAYKATELAAKTTGKKKVKSSTKPKA